jgi:hypothetical protein
MPETIQEYENASTEKKQGKKTARRLAVDILARLEKLKVKVGRISSEWHGELIVRGSSYYVRVPRDLVEYYELTAGDWITLRASEVKRLIGQED